MYPTADQIAHAIVAACKITGADPVAIVSRETDAPSETRAFPISRARSYAALALQVAFPALPRVAIDRVVGAASIGVYLGGLNKRLREGACSTWYDPEKLRGVIDAIPSTPAGAAIIPEISQRPSSVPTIRCGPASPLLKPKPEPPRTPPPAEFIRYGAKRRLEDELRQ